MARFLGGISFALTLLLYSSVQATTSHVTPKPVHENLFISRFIS